jgi:hypothetical protein
MLPDKGCSSLGSEATTFCINNDPSCLLPMKVIRDNTSLYTLAILGCDYYALVVFWVSKGGFNNMPDLYWLAGRPVSFASTPLNPAINPQKLDQRHCPALQAIYTSDR